MVWWDDLRLRNRVHGAESVLLSMPCGDLVDNVNNVDLQDDDDNDNDNFEH